KLQELGFKLLATRGTAEVVRSAGLTVEVVLKSSEGRPNCVDMVRNGEVALIINTPLGLSSHKDGTQIRQAAVAHNVPLITTLSGAAAAVEAIAELKQGHHVTVISLQELHAKKRPHQA